MILLFNYSNDDVDILSIIFKRETDLTVEKMELLLTGGMMFVLLVSAIRREKKII